jgi:hypothetical protein
VLPIRVPSLSERRGDVEPCTPLLRRGAKEARAPTRRAVTKCSAGASNDVLSRKRARAFAPRRSRYHPLDLTRSHVYNLIRSFGLARDRP